MPNTRSLSRREREIIEIVFRKGAASVEEIRESMPESVSYSAVRMIVSVLERKGHLKHIRSGKKYIYSPTTPRARAIKGALTSLLHTYFDDSIHQAVAAMVQLRARDLSDEDWQRLEDAIKQSKREDSS